MRRKATLMFSVTGALFLFCFNTLQAQYLLNSDSAFKAGVPNSGRIWGYIFGDFFYKSHSDSLNRGGNNQYTNIKKGTSEFQFRRIYLGYDYNISKTFSTELLLAAEDYFTGGDLLQDNKFTPYVKLADIRWHDFLFKGNDFVFGLQPTPAFPYMTESVFNYSRPVERTITDIRRTPSFDFGAGMQGRLYNKKKTAIYGYNVLVANGASAKPQNLSGPVYKWFYGDAFVRLLKSKLILDIYSDYQRQSWTPGLHGHAARQMNKLALVWKDPKLTIGVESFVNNLKQDEAGIKGAIRDTLDGKATGTSFYIHGNIIHEQLKFFVRYDIFNPDTKYDHTTYSKYNSLYGVTTSYEPNAKERFLSFGLDYVPVKNVHFIPNIWYSKYLGQQAALSGAANHDYDLVYRATFFFTFGKQYSSPQYSYYPYTR